ncbi:carbohydrate ABC transporter permease [Alicyclobacillus fodiniaquatilis]|uniref:Carbohydrate ABC transporter permease n=1 Tax=Alicyclobacillus fodiniaquatilis TaxID=1661150 RepID=A0ABW4JM58_9BACL
MNKVTRRILQIIIGIVLLFWSLAPLYWGLIVSLSNPSGLQAVPPPIIPKPFTISYYTSLLNGHSAVSLTFLHEYLNSVIEAVLTTVVTVAIAAFAGYGFIRLKFKGSTAIFFVIIGTMSLPIYAVLIPLFQMITNMGLTDTYFAIVVINCSGSLPLAIWLIRSHVASLPVSIEEAARIDGASRGKLVLRIVIPLIAPGMASTSIVVLLTSWSSFLIPLVFAPTPQAMPLTVLITQYATKYATNYGLQAAAGILALIPPIIVVAWFNRHLIRGLLGGSVTS